VATQLSVTHIRNLIKNEQTLKNAIIKAQIGSLDAEMKIYIGEEYFVSTANNYKYLNICHHYFIGASWKWLPKYKIFTVMPEQVENFMMKLKNLIQMY
jgi:hypothetical protein